MVKRFTNRTSATGGGVGVGGGSIHMNAVGGIVAGSTPGSQRGSYNNNNANIQSNNQNNNNNITTCGKCCYYFRQVITFLFSHIGLCTLLCCYALIGAFTFQALESVHEKEQRIKMRKLRDVLIRNLSILTNDSTVLRHEIWTRKARKDLIEFEKEFLHAVKYKGYDGYEELSETNSQWSFSGALLYSIIVITTIGYGNVAPRTEWGKVVTILYAIIGIPLMLFCLSNIGHTMARSFKFIYWKCCCYLCVQPKKKRRKRQQKRRQRQRRKRRRHRHAAIQATLMAMNPLLLSHAPKSQLSPSRPRLSRSHSSQRCEEPNVRTIKQSSSSNTLQIPQRMLSRSLSARYHNELKASRLRAARLAQTNQIISNKMMPARKTTVNMPPVICNQYASCSDERLDRAISAVHRPHVFPRRSSSIANQNTRSDHRQRPTSLQSPQSYPIKQQPSSNAPHQTVTSQRSGTQSSILHQSRNTQPSLSEIEMTTFYNAPNTLNIHNIDDYRLHIESDLDSYFDNDDDDDDDEDDSEEIQEKNIPITVCLALVISYICGGAWFFSTSEEWSFLDASYFCFITLSTIGFGDLVPGRTVLSTHEDGQMTLAICALYLLFGMALLAMSLNLVKEKVLETVRIVGERIGILVIDEDTDDDSDDDDDDDDVVVDDGNDDGNDNNIDDNDNNNDFDSGLNICIHGD